MTPFHAQSEFTIYQDDAGEVLPTLPDAEVSLIATNPPYFRVKDLAWDNQWESADAYLAWLGGLCQQWRRVLRGNGSLYCFASPEMAARVECEIGRWFRVLTSITWNKPPFATKAEMFRKEDLREYFPASERIVFAEQFGSDGYSPISAAITAARASAGIRSTDIDIALGYVRTKDPRRGTELCRRWEEGSSIPSQDDFERVMQLCGTDRLNYEDIRQQYESLRRPFFASPDSHYTDVWDFPTVSAYPGKHPCAKPFSMALHLIKTSSRPGDTVLDCFCGSGVFGEAAVALGRHFIGIEQDPHWAEETVYRLQRRLARPELPVIRSRRPAAEPVPGQMRLFGEEVAA